MNRPSDPDDMYQLASRMVSEHMECESRARREQPSRVRVSDYMTEEAIALWLARASREYREAKEQLLLFHPLSLHHRLYTGVVNDRARDLDRARNALSQWYGETSTQEVVWGDVYSGNGHDG